MKQLLIIAVVLSAGFSHQWVDAQTEQSETERVKVERLQVGSTITDQTNETVQLKGTVVEVKKYTVVLDVDGKNHQVKLLKGADLKLRLDKPFF